jgi:exonuclease III
MMKMITWNIAQSADVWSLLFDSNADVALLQEAREPPADVAAKVQVNPDPWRTGSSRSWRAAIVKLSNHVNIEWLEAKSLSDAQAGELGVGRTGTLAAATVTPSSGDSIIAVSVYALWEKPHTMTKGDFIYADASVHRLISDLSVFASKQSRQNMIVAGDLNVLYGYGEYGDTYWAGRYETVFSRMAALGLSFVSPQAPDGRQAEPWPEELPRNSNNVPTYHTKRQTPATCTRQLDFVFASQGLAERVRVRALNEPDQWGPSDHCRVEIQIA